MPGSRLPRPTLVLASPLLRRIAWHARRIARGVDRKFFLALAEGAGAIVLVAAMLVTLLEKPWTEGLGKAVPAFGQSVNWAIFTVLGQGDAGYVTTIGGYVVSWLLVVFGVAIVGTGNATARELIAELRGDEYKTKIVVLADVEKNPVGSDFYFVRGDTTSAEDLRRAGIEEAAAALVFPDAPTNEADMHSILTVMAIESIAPDVRTVAEVINPRHVEHFERAKADEVLVTSSLASHLLARSALYPGLSALVTDIVSGGEGSELYRVDLPSAYCGLTVDDLSARLRSEHHATLLAISRGSRTYVNPPSDFVLQPFDDALVVAESLGTLQPLRPGRAMPAPA